jgi:hypothetical protein
MGIFLFVEKMSSVQKPILRVDTAATVNALKPIDKVSTTPAPTTKVETKPFRVTDVDYSTWLSYTNPGHKYTLKYPADWTLDTKGADVLETYDDDSCCKAAVLNIKKGNTYWRLTTDSIYTGGGGFNEDYFYDQCKPLDKTPCVFTFYGPIDLGQTKSTKILLRVLTNTTDGKILVGTVGGPVFYSRILPQNNQSYEAAATSIDYLGDDLNANMEVLNKITNSVKFF